MTKLIFYNQDGGITRVMSSTRPKRKWKLSTYGLDAGEYMKLLDDSELPLGFHQGGFLFDGTTFTKIKPEPMRDAFVELDEIKARLDKLEKKEMAVL